MDIIHEWMLLGADRVELLDRKEVEGQPGTVVLALFAYRAEVRSEAYHPWIHPYYFRSHQAYLAHQQWLAAAKADGLSVLPGEDIRLKPLFHRMPGYTYGHNTLCYAPDIGSRYHVRVVRLADAFPPTCHLEVPKSNHCGSCTRCIQSCPTGAISRAGFTPEKCIRYWQLSGKPIPVWIRAKMGNRLVGCDDCQQVCPHNQPASPAAEPWMPLKTYLTAPDAAAEQLHHLVGSNLSISNRVLGQACIVAGNSGEKACIPLLETLRKHPSPVVADHAAWAAAALRNDDVTP